MAFTLIYDTRHILISSHNFRLSCVPWISHAIRLSPVLLLFPSHSICCFLHPCLLPHHSYSSFLDSDIKLIHGSPLLFNTIVRHNQNHIIIYLFAGFSLISVSHWISMRETFTEHHLTPALPSMSLPWLGVEAWGFMLLRTLLPLPA